MTWAPIPILMYHAVEDRPRPPKYKHFYVTASEFRRQMHRLAQLGYQPIPLSLLGQALDGKADLTASGTALNIAKDGLRAEDRPPRPNNGVPESGQRERRNADIVTGTGAKRKPIVLTFDDGYADLLANVDPILCERGWPYTVFLVSGRVGGRNEWVEPDGYEATPLLTWSQIDEMRRNGRADFQAHTVTHPNLASAADDRIRRELAECRTELEEKLGTAVETLCYPYGGYTDRAVAIAQEVGYRLAVTTDFGRVRQGDDPMRLPRVSIYHVPPFSLTYGPATMNFDWRVRSRVDKRPEHERDTDEVRSSPR